MKKLIPAILMVLIMTVSAYAADGMVCVKSSFGVNETGDRLESVLKEKGMTIFNRVNCTEATKEIGLELRETELIISGNPMND